MEPPNETTKFWDAIKTPGLTPPENDPAAPMHSEHAPDYLRFLAAVAARSPIPGPPELVTDFATRPFDVPPWQARPEPITFTWWSWHPCYPHWAESCWKADTVEAAWDIMAKPGASGLMYYHNKLIRKDATSLVEVADFPCQVMEIWHRFAIKGFKMPNMAPVRAEYVAPPINQDFLDAYSQGSARRAHYQPQIKTEA